MMSRELITAILLLPICFIGSVCAANTNINWLEKTSVNGRYIATVSFAGQHIPLNKMHAWKLELKNSAGLPVKNAHIKVSGGMPAHQHGMPTQPQMTQNLGKGVYLIEGLKFQMAGGWQVNFEITDGRVTDKIIFDLQLTHGSTHE
jgi:uncharacterized cupredoxin-like copper-binding protein